jgi:transcriptional regulator with XRE-family HTH domain
VSTEEYIALRVAELCKKHNMSVYRLSQRSGITQTALSHIISGKSVPTIPTVNNICGAFGVTLAQFFAGEGEKPDLSADQMEILDIWDTLDDTQRNIVIRFLRGLRNENS